MMNHVSIKREICLLRRYWWNLLSLQPRVEARLLYEKSSQCLSIVFVFDIEHLRVLKFRYKVFAQVNGTVSCLVLLPSSGDSVDDSQSYPVNLFSSFSSHWRRHLEMLHLPMASGKEDWAQHSESTKTVDSTNIMSFTVEILLEIVFLICVAIPIQK